MRREDNALGFDVEALEDRKMLAGNVTVSVSGGILRINGDGQSNEIRVSKPAGTDLVIDAGHDTRINGGSLGGERAINLNSNQINGVRINMGYGHDVLTLDNIGYAPVGDVDVDMGGSHDTVNVRGAVYYDLDIDGGIGHDTIDFFDVQSQSDVKVTGGRNRDVLQVDYSSFAGNLTVRLGADNDDVQIADTEVDGDLTIRLGSGEIGTVQDAALNVEVGGDLKVYGGGAKDAVNIFNSSVAGTTDVLTYGDLDYVRVHNSSLEGRLRADGGTNFRGQRDIFRGLSQLRSLDSVNLFEDLS